MRKSSFVLLATIVVAAVPAAAQLPISGIGGSGSGREAATRQRWLGPEDRLGPSPDPRSGDGLLVQLRQENRRAERERDDGLISRRESRHIHRETERIRTLYGRYSNDGLSSAEVAELQSRIHLLRSSPRPTAQTASSHGH